MLLETWQNKGKGLLASKEQEGKHMGKPVVTKVC